MSIREALNKASTVDPFSAFLPVDSTSMNADPQYIGFMTPNGAWIIKKYSESTGITRFTGGDSGYSTAWTDRETLDYTYPDGSV